MKTSKVTLPTTKKLGGAKSTKPFSTKTLKNKAKMQAGLKGGR